ncbi:glutathionylspermidine synthase family protein [Shigella flexneri]
MVFEPLSTVIPATRRFCRCCGRCSRTHPYLLNTIWSKQHLAKTGYAIKPISGRCGSDVDLVSGNEKNRLLDQTSGKFIDQELPQLWCLPNISGKYIQVCTFTVGGNYGGTCLRGDKLW